MECVLLSRPLQLRPSRRGLELRSRKIRRETTARISTSGGVTSFDSRAKRIPGTLEADVIVIGSGIGGLCCAGTLAKYGQHVLVLECHDLPGGAAHSFEIKDYKFDSGPSLFSGFQSRGPQANPLAQVLYAVGESVPCARYDSWMVYLPEGDFLSRIGPMDFLNDAVIPMSAAAMALPPLSIRGDWGVLSTAGAPYAPLLTSKCSGCHQTPQTLLRYN